MKIKKLVVTGLITIALLGGCGKEKVNDEQTVFRNDDGIFTLLMKASKVTTGEHKGEYFLTDGQGTLILVDENMKDGMNYEVVTDYKDDFDTLVSYEKTNAVHSFKMDKAYMNEEKGFYLEYLKEKGSN